jgi:hypothetical protein
MSITSTPIVVGSSAGLPVEVSMGGDMSAARATSALYIGKAGSYSVDISVPATPDGGTNAAGTFAIQENGTNDDTRWETVPICLEAAFVAFQPTGTGAAKAVLVKNIATSCPRVRVIYTPASGGADVVPAVCIY